ncbi:unnamed protein product [Cunninghamella blakesleeana]
MSFLKDTPKFQDYSIFQQPSIQQQQQKQEQEQQQQQPTLISPAPTKALPQFTDEIQQLISSRQRRSFSVPPRKVSDDEMEEGEEDEMERFRPRLNQRRRLESVRFSPAPPEIFEYPSTATKEPTAITRGLTLNPIPLPWYSA